MPEVVELLMMHMSKGYHPEEFELVNKQLNNGTTTHSTKTYHNSKNNHRISDCTKLQADSTFYNTILTADNVKGQKRRKDKDSVL